jgi:uncharacterized protein (UPF0303 family)
MPNFEADRAFIHEQERQLILPAFDAHVAWSLGATLRRLALERGEARGETNSQARSEASALPLAIDVRRFGTPAQILFHCELPGTTPDNGRWIERKSNVVARFHRSSYAVGLFLAQFETTVPQKYALPDADYATHGGAFPIAVANAGILGSVTVSGLPQREDHNLVVEALCLHLNLDPATLRLPNPS